MQKNISRFETTDGLFSALTLLVLGCLVWVGILPNAAAAQDAAQVVVETSVQAPSTALRIQGRVLQDDGTPRPGATVRLLPQSVAQDEAEQRWRGVRSRVAASMISGKDGRFEVITPDAGFWLLEVSLPGYATQRYALTPLVDHAVLPDVTLSPTQGFTLRVLDSKGEPAAARFSAQLQSDMGSLLRRFRNWNGSAWALNSWEGRTDDQGEAKLPLPDGEWQIDVVAAGHEPVQISLKDTTEVRLQPAGDRIAEVVLADGRPAAGVYAYLEEGGLPIAKTDKAGRAELSLSMRKHDLAWWYPAGEQATSILPAVDTDRGDGSQDGTEVHRVELEPLLPAAGRVVESKERSGLDNAWVWVTTDLGLLATRSAGDGHYAFAVPTGDNSGIRATASGYGLTYGNFSPPPPEERAEGIQLTLLLKATSGLQGTVVDAEGRPVEGVSARLVAGASRNRFSNQFIEAYRLQGLSDAQGRLDFRGLSAEQGYTLRLKKDGLAPAEFPVDALKIHELRRDLRWTLARGTRGVGQIVDQEDQPIVGAEVRLTSASTGRRGMPRFRPAREDKGTRQTDREGRFVLPDLAPGRFDLEAKAPGFSRGVVRGLEVPEGVGELDFGVLMLAPGVDLPGRVVDIDGVPLAGVEIMAFPAGDRRSQMFEMMGIGERGSETMAVSGEDGRFVIEDRTAGDQLNVSGLKEGFTKGMVRGVTLPTDKPIEIVMQRASGISGRVVDADGSPLNEVTVTAVPNDAMAARRARLGLGDSVTTDLDGRFELDGVAPGLNGLRAQKSGFQALQVSGFEVPAEQPLEGVELRLLKGADLVGSLKDADGEAVAGGVILIMDGNMGIVDGGFAQTDGDGAFQVSGLPLGKFIVSATQGGQKASQHITVEEGENTVELAFEVGLPVGGQVSDARGAPVQGARVTLRPVEVTMTGYQAVESTADGSFRFEKVAAGDYRLVGQKEGVGIHQFEESIKVADAAIEGIQLRLGGGARIVGRILGLSYDEMNRVQISAGGTGSNEVTQPNFEGMYRVDHVRAGSVVVTARLSGSSRTVQEQVTIEEGEVEVAVDLEFVDGYVLTGTVYKTGEPLDGLSLSLTKTGGVSINATTDGEGRFRFEGLEEGGYEIRTSGWGTSIQYRQDIELTGDDDIRIDLEVARLAGQVVDDDGQPISSAFLLLDREGKQSFTETSDSLGRFDFGDTSVGVWQLTARRSGYAGDPITVELEAGQVKDDVRLELRAVRGILLDVKRQDGRSLSSVSVGFLGASVSQGGGMLQGDDAGRFVVDTLPDGTWQMVLSARDYGTVVQPVTAPSEDPVQVVLQPEGRLLITVPALRDEGLGGILKLVSSAGHSYYTVRWGGQVEETFSLQGGVRHLNGLTPGTWSVNVTGDDGRVWQGSVEVQAGDDASLELQ